MLRAVITSLVSHGCTVSMPPRRRTSGKTRVRACRPHPRNTPCIAYDPYTSKVILFGGYDGSDRNDTWQYDTLTNTWTELAPIVSPPARDSSGMVYDASIGRILLFGGYSNGANLNDTWAYDAAANTWTQLNPQVSPPGRYGYAMDFDAVTGRTVIFGGGIYPVNSSPNNFLNDTWTYDSIADTWIQIVSVNIPGRREFANMSYDSATGQLVLFGGINNNNNPKSYDDTWTLDLGTSPVITSPSSVVCVAQTQVNFTVTASGSPAPSITVYGGALLPSGITLTDNGDGTACLCGSTTQVGVFIIVFEASNGIAPTATQTFALIVEASVVPSITSANTVTYALNQTFLFTSAPAAIQSFRKSLRLALFPMASCS